MNLKVKTLILLFITIISQATAQNSIIKDVHKQQHQKLLANAKSQLDKSVLQDYLKNEIEKRENPEILLADPSSEIKAMISDLIGEAKTHIGKRYRSGGKGPNAFDCSGFSSYIFQQFGFSLGASSRDQFKQGTEVKINNLRPGDLVFFTGRNSKSGRVGHVGIVVTANNEEGTFSFIHASTSQGIKIDTNKGYYEGRYLGAKRIIE